MNFNLSEEQNMLKDSVARFVRDEYDFDSRRANASSELGFNPANWQMFAELGWQLQRLDSQMTHGKVVGCMRGAGRPQARPGMV